MRRSLVLGLVLVACGGGGGDDMDVPDAMADAPPQVCTVDPGRSYVVTQIRILPPTEGYDVTGDGVIDNSIGNIPPGYQSSLEGGYDTSIMQGSLLILFNTIDWNDLVMPAPNQPSITVQVFSGTDSDDPPDPSDNLMGMGEFTADLSQFDLTCNPLSEAGPGVMTDYVLHLEGPEWSYPLNPGRGTMTITNVIFDAQFPADFSTFDTKVGGIFKYCSLQAIPFPSDIPGSILDVLVNDPTLMAAVQPDVDLDGDGMEQVIGDGQTVMKCIDGDGTEILGRDCVCHPNIVDGYSFAIDMQAIIGTIVGVR